MSKAGDATQQLAAALDRLKACRATDKDYVAASQEVLAEITKLGPLGLDASSDLMDLYQQLNLEFLYAEKCAELRMPAFGGNTASQTSKY
jgi:hypothetical protein